MAKDQEHKLWVGSVDGRALVYDPAMQIADSPHLFLWNAASRAMERYVRSILKPQIRPHADGAVCAKATQDYLAWHRMHGVAWLTGESESLRVQAAKDAERKAREAREAAEREAEIIERHRATLAKLGRAPATVRRVTERPSKQRVTHCYACKDELDSSIDLQCTACRWILCECGTCGCGYDHSRRSNPRWEE